MTEKKKKMIALLGSLFILCTCCGGFIFWLGALFSRSIITDPVQIKAVSQEIAEYTLPAGYSEILGIRFLNAKSVALADDALSPAILIFLMQVPEAQGLSEVEMEQQLQTMLRRLNLQPLDFVEERSEPRTVNDQTVEVTYHLATDKAGADFKQMTLFFRTRQGKVFLMAQGAEADWDQEALDALLESIH